MRRPLLALRRWQLRRAEYRSTTQMHSYDAAVRHAIWIKVLRDEIERLTQGKENQ